MRIRSKIIALLFTVSGFSEAVANPLTEAGMTKATGHIDSLIKADLKEAGLVPNGKIDDGTFVRRAYLGIVGRIPSADEARNFLESSEEGKRGALIDSLVASPGFDSHLFNWGADLLRVKTKQEQFGLGWHVWLRKSLAEDKPWDVLVSEMLASTGHAANNPAVGYYLRDRNMQLDNFSNTIQVFLGRQIGCAQCHDHPFDDWSQMDYYQMAAFTGGTKYRSKDANKAASRVAADTLTYKPKPYKEDKGKSKKRYKSDSQKIARSVQPVFKDFHKNAIFEDPEVSLRLPEDYKYSDAEPKEVVEPVTLFGKRISGTAPGERKAVFARWVTSPENPYFTKVIANRLWARTFGHGLFAPVDDWSEDSEPAHPEVLEFLEETMKGVNYDLRQFARILFHTELFQRECEAVEPAPGVAHLVRGPRLQRMTAEQLYDSLLVLRFGKTEDGISGDGQQRWGEYTAHIKRLLELESKELLELGEAASKAEFEFRKAQGEVLKLQRKLSGTADQEEKKAAEKMINKAKDRVKRFGKLRDPGRFDGKKLMEAGGGNRDKQKNSVLRASEQPAPFNPGSLVRDFGGSDRETPSSGNTNATVPQALTLLNDWDAEVMGRKYHLGGSLAKLNAEQRLDMVFLSLYSRLPGKKEVTKFLSFAEDYVSLRDLGRAMLTSDRFIFIQ